MPRTGTAKTKNLPGTINWYAYGSDFGNSEICGVLIKGGKVLTKSVPTAFASLEAAALRNMNVDMTNALIIQFKDESEEWGIGELSLQQAANIWHGRNDPLRYASKHHLRSILGMSASLTNDQEYGLVVTTGLPAQIFQASIDPNTDMDLRKEIRKAITGVFTFTVDNGKTWRTCHVEYGGCLMEGAGAAASIQKSKSSNPPPIGIIDIGGRTTDLYVAQKGVPIVSLCQGTPLGVVTAEDAFRKAFKDKYHFPPSDLEVRQCMFAYANSKNEGRKPYPEISHYGSTIPGAELDKLVGTAATATGIAIVSFVASAWHESDQSIAIAVRYDPCVVVGGGAWFFIDALKQRIKHLQRHPNPVFANGIGYARNSERKITELGLAEFREEVEVAKAATAIFVEGSAETVALPERVETASYMQDGNTQA